MKEINSVDNFFVKQWLKLKDKDRRNEQKLFIVEGYHLITEAYKANLLKEVITTEDKQYNDITTYKVRQDVMDRLSSLATATKAIGICYQKEKEDYKGNILLVDQIHHPGNLGTIIRSAVAFNVDTIILNESVDIYNQKVIQATQGMIFHINIIKAPLKEIMLELKNQGYQIIGTDVREGVELSNFKPNKKHALLMGNEGNGLSDDLLSLCDIKLNIEMNDKCESLNVGVATGIILYNLR